MLIVALSAGVPACGATVPRPGNVRALAASGWTEQHTARACGDGGLCAGCLDVRIAPVVDPVVPRSAAVFAFDFVNACRDRVQVDLEAVRVFSLQGDGSRAIWPVFDPAHELRPATLAAGASGAEAIEFDPPAGHAAARPANLARVCVDLAGLSPDAVARPSATWALPPRCFGLEGGALVPIDAANPPPPGTPASLPPREVSLVVGYRHFSRFGDGWDEGAALSHLRRSGSPYDEVALVTSFRTYSLGSLLAEPDSPSSGARRVGCVDVRVEALRASVAKTSLALAFTLGNRCERGAWVSLARARVTAEWADGSTRTLALYDPAKEVGTPLLDGHARATELLQYFVPGTRGVDAPSSPPRSVCVDVSPMLVGSEAAPPVAPICLSQRGTFANEDTIVGHQAFEAEAWSAQRFPRFVLELGAAVSLVELGGVTLNGKTSSGTSFALDASPYRAAGVYDVDMRLLWRLGGPFYAGGMLRAGAGPFQATVPASATAPEGRARYLVDLAAGAVGGMVLVPSPWLRLRADLTLGARVLGTDVYPPGCDSDTCDWSPFLVRWLVAPRVVVEPWIAPWFSVAAWVDADALYIPDVAVGLSFGLHFRAYDGGP